MNIETKKWEVLCSEEQIASRLKELGAQISKDYEGKKLLVVSLLKGSFIFCADLVRNITVPVKIEFMTTSSYGHGEVSTGNVKVVSDVNCDLEGYDVLIVDDITDTALTMHHVMNHLKAKNPNSVKSCVLLDKPSRRKVELVPDYCGFEIEDKFVVGYRPSFWLSGQRPAPAAARSRQGCSPIASKSCDFSVPLYISLSMQTLLNIYSSYGSIIVRYIGKVKRELTAPTLPGVRWAYRGSAGHRRART